jgi:hypothetical protein
MAAVRFEMEKRLLAKPEMGNLVLSEALTGLDGGGRRLGRLTN